MPKTGKRNTINFSVSLPKMLFEDLNEELAMLENEDYKFSRSELIQVLIFRFLIQRQEARKRENNKNDNKENKEEN